MAYHNNRENQVESEDTFKDLLDELIDELESISAEDDLEEIYTHVGTANELFAMSTTAMFSTPSRGRASSIQSFNWKSPGIKAKVKKWIKKLRKKISKVAKNVNADSFSISVSSNFSVSVQVTFSV